MDGWMIDVWLSDWIGGCRMISWKMNGQLGKWAARWTGGWMIE